MKILWFIVRDNNLSLDQSKSTCGAIMAFGTKELAQKEIEITIKENNRYNYFPVPVKCEIISEMQLAKIENSVEE